MPFRMNKHYFCYLFISTKWYKMYMFIRNYSFNFFVSFTYFWRDLNVYNLYQQNLLFLMEIKVFIISYIHHYNVTNLRRWSNLLVFKKGAYIGYLRIYNIRIAWNSGETKITEKFQITFQKPGTIDKLIRDIHCSKQMTAWQTDSIYLSIYIHI